MDRWNPFSTPSSEAAAAADVRGAALDEAEKTEDERKEKAGKTITVTPRSG
jgi:hypothetical protein